MVPVAIAGIILVFMAVDVAIQTIQHRRGRRVHGFFIPDSAEEESNIPLNYGRMVDCLRSFGIAPPQNVFLHKGHTWAAIDGSGEAAIGLDAFAQRAIGKVDKIHLPQIGQKVRQGETFMKVRQGNRTAEFVAPIDGTVTSVAGMVPQRGSRLPEWVCKIKPNNLSVNLRALKIAEDAVKWMYEELFRLQELVAMQIPRLQTVGATMQDGAVALDNLLENLDDEAWKLFNERFLKSSLG